MIYDLLILAYLFWFQSFVEKKFDHYPGKELAIALALQDYKTASVMLLEIIIISFVGCFLLKAGLYIFTTTLKFLT